MALAAKKRLFGKPVTLNNIVKFRKRTNNKVDADLPFDLEDLKRQTNTDYVDMLSRSDIPILGRKRS